MPNYHIKGIFIINSFKVKVINNKHTHTHTHTHIYICKCIYICKEVLWWDPRGSEVPKEKEEINCKWHFLFCFCFLLSWWNQFCLKLTFFFLFPNLSLIIAQQTSIPVNCFMAGGWHISCHHTSNIYIVGEGAAETPLALRFLFYLINSFLTDIKHLAKN